MRADPQAHFALQGIADQRHIDQIGPKRAFRLVLRMAAQLAGHGPLARQLAPPRHGNHSLQIAPWPGGWGSRAPFYTRATARQGLARVPSRRPGRSQAQWTAGASHIKDAKPATVTLREFTPWRCVGGWATTCCSSLLVVGVAR